MSVADLPFGTEHAGYRVEALLGRGGMGVVYRAHDLALDRPVALKILAPELAEDVRFRERFLRESRVAASIDHPNVVPVYDAGEVAGELFIAMRYVEGSDLKRLLAEGPPEKARAVAIVGQVAAALDAAHARGLVHRDVKPSNVLVADGDHVYLADFGLTRRLGDAAEALGAAQSLGTADYVAPEQIRGDEVDARADLYSLGCLLYECLAGEPPFRRDSEAATLFAHLEEAPPAPTGLDAVMRTALAKDPDSRYQSGQELVEAARSALGLEAKRVRWPLALAAVGLALIGAALLAFFLTRDGGAGVKAEPGADSLVRIDPGGNHVTRSISVGRRANGVAVDDRHVWVTSHDDGTVWRIDPGTSEVLRISAHGTPTSIATDGRRVVVADGEEHSIASFDAASGRLASTSTLEGITYGSLLVASGKSGTWFGDEVAGIVGKVDRALAGENVSPDVRIPIPTDRTSFLSVYNSFDGVAVGEDAVWLAGDVFDRSIWRIDPRSERVAAKFHLPFIPDAIAAGEGAVWVTSLLDDTVSRIDPRSGRIVTTIRVGRGPDAIAAGDGAVWVTSTIDDSLWRIDPSTGRVVAVVPVRGTPTAVAVGHSGVWVTVARPAPAPPANAIKIGIFADCNGPFGPLYDLSRSASDLPLIERGGRLGAQLSDGVTGVTIGGRPVRVYYGCVTDGMARWAANVAEVRRLVEKDGVDVVIGPTVGDNELVLNEYASRQPHVTFVDGSGPDPIADPAPNFFAFQSESAQWMAGLGEYAYRQLGWRRAVTIAGDEFGVYGWGQAAAFTAEFCSLGGTIAQWIWLPQGISDLSGVISALPKGIDGFVLTSNTPRLLALANGYPGLRGNLSRKVILGYSVATSEVARLGRRVNGVVTAGPTDPPISNATSGALPMVKYRRALTNAFPRIPAGQIGQIFDVSYYTAMEAVLQALERVHGDLSGGERRFMATLARLRIGSPVGQISLDASHQAVAPNYLFQLRVHGSRTSSRLIKTIPNVEPSFGGYFKRTDPVPSESTPACVKRTPPPWAR